MKCKNCDHLQETGSFCGSCGTKFGEGVDNSSANVSTEHAATVEISQSESTVSSVQPAQPAQPNVHVENLKEKSKMYWSYFVKYLKRPAQIFEKPEKEFVNGIATIIIFAILVGLTQYSALNGLTRAAFGFAAINHVGVSFVAVFINGIFSTLIGIGLVALILLIMSKFFGSDYSFKSTVSIYGTHIVPVLIAALVSFLLVLASSYVLGMALLVISFAWAIIIIPAYLVISLITRRPKKVDPLYAFGIYIALSAFVFTIYSSVVIASTVTKFSNMLSF